jgi:hypothetical protein
MHLGRHRWSKRGSRKAALTLRRLPDTRVPGYFNTWRQIIRSVHEAFGWDRARMPRIAPSPQAISRMEETFTWLTWLEPDDARIKTLGVKIVSLQPGEIELMMPYAEAYTPV